MDRPLIIYLHGFCSSPASWKSRLLGEEMAARPGGTVRLPAPVAGAG